MKYFIYSHELEGVIFYIGCGAIRPPKEGCHSFGVKYERAYIFAQRMRSWKDYVNGMERDIKVNILEHYEKKEDAYNREIELIQLHANTVINTIGTLPVYQFTLGGEFIKKHISLKCASYSTKTDRASINNVLLGNRRSAGGFLWSKYETVVVPNSFKERVIQKDFSGNVVASYKSLAEAAMAMKTCSSSAIRNCFTGKQKQAYGYLWSIIETHPQEAKERGYSVSRLSKRA